MALLQPFIVVAIAGLVRPIQVRTQKLLTHCGVTAVEIPYSADALQALRRKVWVNAVVIDARSLAAADQTAETAEGFAAMASSGGYVSQGGAPASVIVLGNRHVPAWVRPICERTGARFFPTAGNGPNFPKLIRMLRQMCGIETACCKAATFEGDR